MLQQSIINSTSQLCEETKNGTREESAGVTSRVHVSTFRAKKLPSPFLLSYGVGRASQPLSQTRSHLLSWTAMRIASGVVPRKKKLTMTTAEQWKPSFHFLVVRYKHHEAHDQLLGKCFRPRGAAISGESLASQSLALPGSCFGGFGLSYGEMASKSDKAVNTD